MNPNNRDFPWLAWLIVLQPRRVQAALARVQAAGHVVPAPNVWQICLGVLRMWHRMVYRPETIGLSVDPVRSTWRARCLRYRPIRFPFLIAERAVAPFDLSGLVSSPERIRRHLMGAHHDTRQFVYDLEILALFPGELERLREEANALVRGNDRRSLWLRDLVVFEGYHERLLEAVCRQLSGTLERDDDPDISFNAYLRWCAAQPTTPAESLAAWRSRGSGQVSSR